MTCPVYIGGPIVYSRRSNDNHNRVVQTLKHEVLNEFVVVSEKHLNDICREAQTWCDNERGHSARKNLPPDWSEQPEEVQTIKLNDVACSTRLGGLLKHYWRRAA